MAGCLDGAQSKFADLEDLFVLDELVIRRQHVRVFTGDMHVVPSVAHLGDCTDVVVMTVCLDHGAHPQVAGQFE